MKTLAQLAHTLHAKLAKYFDKMLPEFEKAMEETQGYDLILDTLNILRRIFRATDVSTDLSYFQSNYQRILAIITKALNHEYSKVVSEGLRVAGSFVYILKGADGSTLDARFNSVV
jgi:hypothetical protein